jgi:hypothetical protein
METEMNDSPMAADPLKTIADAVSMAAQAASDGAGDAQARAAEMMPAVSDFVGRLAYNGSYAVSYGIVFSTLFVARLVPEDNPLVQGLIDGAQAARDSATAKLA